MNLNSFGILYSNDIYFFEGVFGGCFGDLKCFENRIHGWMCVAARAPAVTMIRGSIFQPRVLISSSSDLYLLRFWSMVSGENLSLQ